MLSIHQQQRPLPPQPQRLDRLPLHKAISFRSLPDNEALPTTIIIMRELEDILQLEPELSESIKTDKRFPLPDREQSESKTTADSVPISWKDTIRGTTKFPIWSFLGKAPILWPAEEVPEIPTELSSFGRIKSFECRLKKKMNNFLLDRLSGPCRTLTE